MKLEVIYVLEAATAAGIAAAEALEVKQDPERDRRRFPEAGAPAGEERGIRTRSAGKGRPTPTTDPGDAASRPRFPSWRPPGVSVPGCHLDARGWGGRAGRA